MYTAYIRNPKKNSKNYSIYKHQMAKIMDFKHKNQIFHQNFVSVLNYLQKYKNTPGPVKV